LLRQDVKGGHPMSQPLMDGSASLPAPMGSAGSDLGSPSGAISTQSEVAGDKHSVDALKPLPTAGSPRRIGPDEVAELARGAVSGAVVAWPGGAVSLLGAALCLIAVIGATLANPLGMGMFITTVVVGGLLAILGPVVIAGNQFGIRRTVEKLADAEDSDPAGATERRMKQRFPGPN
jgi:hypothetical protein